MFLNFKKLLFLFVLNLVVMYGSDELEPSIISMITASILCPWDYSKDTNITYRLCEKPSKAQIDYAKEQFCLMVPKKRSLGSNEENIKRFFEIGKVSSYFKLSRQLCIFLRYSFDVLFEDKFKVEEELAKFSEISTKLVKGLYSIFNNINKSSYVKQLYSKNFLRDLDRAFLNDLFNGGFSFEAQEEHFQKLRYFIEEIYNCNENSEEVGVYVGLGQLIKDVKTDINYFIDNKSIRNLYSAFYNSEFNGWVEEKTNVTRVVFIIAAAVLWCFIIYSIYLKWKISVK